MSGSKASAGPVECPHCGFMNLHEGRECARCRKVLPGREHWAIKSEDTGSVEISDSQVELTGTDTHETLPPSEWSQEQKEAPKTTAEPGAASTDEIEPGPAEKMPEVGKPEKSAPEIKTPDSKRVPLFDEQSLTYTGSDAELREISRFFKEAKKKEQEQLESEASLERMADVKEETSQSRDQDETEASISRVEITPPEDFSEARAAEESSDSFKPDFRSSFLPEFDEDSFKGAADVKAAPGMPEARNESLSAAIYLRAMAGAVDLAIYAIIFTILYMGAAWAAHLDDASFTMIQWLVKVLIPLAMIMIVIFLFSETFFALTSGQTPGQMMFNLKTQAQHEKPLSFSQALIFALIYLILMLPLGLGLITIILGQENRGAHEQLSGTKIIKSP
jgi:uncharacterized RDD family membrane protein YckC